MLKAWWMATGALRKYLGHEVFNCINGFIYWWIHNQILLSGVGTFRNDSWLEVVDDSVFMSAVTYHTNPSLLAPSFCCFLSIRNFSRCQYSGYISMWYICFYVLLNTFNKYLWSSFFLLGTPLGYWDITVVFSLYYLLDISEWDKIIYS